MLALTSLGAQSKTTTTPIQIKATVVVDTPKPLIDTNGKLKELTKINSDIRVFLNRERKVENIKIIFPKINKRKLS